MNTKPFILGLALLSILWISACKDDLNLVGGSIQPGEDEIGVYTDTFQVEASTVLLDSIYAKTTVGLLGEIYDPTYGYLKADYICQFYCMDEYQFAKTPVDGKIDSVDFFIVYSGSVGDSLTPMRAQVYQVNSALEKNYYTNVDPSKFCDRSIPLGAKTYTAYDASISDSIRGITDTTDSLYYTPHVRIRMDKSLGQRIYDETIHNPASFKNQAAFNAFFPGIYVTNTFGSGNMLNVYSSSFAIYYHYRDTLVSSSGVADSVVIKKTQEVFYATPEVIQLNRVRNMGLDKLVNDPDYVYMKTPAGAVTKLVIPAKEIAPLVEGRVINNMSFSLMAMPQEETQFPLLAPPTVVLMPEDSLSFFFQKGYTDVNSLAIPITYTTSTRKYNFGNISNILKVHIKNSPDEDLRLVVVPVTRETGTVNNITQTTSMTNLMSPSAVKIRRDKESMKMEVVSSKYEK